VQDSNHSWELNARQMDLVYGNATLTICAADGANANFGIIGLDPSRRVFTQHIEEYNQDVRLMVSHLAETYIRKSQWNTTAWTFQERLLSKRCLIFPEGRVYFQCRSTAMSEDIIAEDEGARWSIELVDAPLQILSDLEHRAIYVYKNCVELYSSRDLTKPDDVLSAFHGITNLLRQNLDGSFVHGLPSSYFDWALLWEPQDAPTRRRKEEFANQDGSHGNGESPKWTSDVDFPSWSWVGWFGKRMEYKTSMIEGTLTNLREWLMKHTWICWYIRDGRGSLRPVWCPYQQANTGQQLNGETNGHFEPSPPIRTMALDDR
jgi:hypothetical protein